MITYRICKMFRIDPHILLRADGCRRGATCSIDYSGHA
jgi:hypothetical protein